MASAIPYGTAFGNVLLKRSQACNNSLIPLGRSKGKRRSGIAFRTFGQKQKHSLQTSSVLDKQTGNVNSSNNNNKNENGVKDPARAALERLFSQTQRLEEQMLTGSSNVKDSTYDLNLEGLESDLQVALAALKKKEEELQAAERAVAMDRRKLEKARMDLDRRQKEITAARTLQKRLEKDLQKSRHDFAIQAGKLKEMKLLVDERDREIGSIKYALGAKEEELGRVKKELTKKEEELAKICTDFKSRDKVVGQANEVIAKQQFELKELERILKERENDLVQSEKKRREDEDKLKIAEANLENRVVAWLLVQQELKKLGQDVSKYKGTALDAEEEVKRVRNLLADVKGELRNSQRSIESSRKRLKAQEAQLESQHWELSLQKNKIQSYETNLRNAHLEVENEREKLRLAQTYHKELEQHLAKERQTVNELQTELQRENSCLDQAMEEVSALKKELEQRNATFNDAQSLLQLKESELVAARLEMQRLKSDVIFFQRNLRDKDKDLEVAQKNLEELHEEISQFKCLMRAKEDQLVKATLMLKDKEEQVKMMQFDLDDNKLKLSEAASVVEHIADLTRILVDSAKEGKGLTLDKDSLLMHTNCELFATNRALLESEMQLQHIQEKSVEDLRKWKQAEAELEATKECLREKEKDLLVAHRALAVKDQELRTLLNRWEAREKELVKMREEVIDEANGLNSLHAVVQRRIGEKTLGELALEKLELEAAHLEIEAAMCALRNLADLSHELLRETKTSLNLSADNIVLSPHTVDVETQMTAHKGGSEVKAREGLAALKMRLTERDAALEETKKAVTDLSKLTKQLISQAGITHAEITHKGGEATTNANAATKEMDPANLEATTT
eukprot:Gb_38718 [translate_table: standard]